MLRRATELDGQYTGQPMWVVGRGPSLADLRAYHIGEGPVVAINQAIEVAEALHLPNPLFSMQKDLFFVAPKSGGTRILAHEKESAAHFREDLERLNTYVFDCEEDFSFPWNVPSVVACAGLAYRMGCRQVTYLCCDAATDGITEAYGQPATEPSAYLMHGLLVKRYARIPVEWMKVKELIHEGF